MTNDSRQTGFIILQVHPTLHPRSAAVQSNALLPVAADGFYSDKAMATEIAELMIERAPKGVETYVAKVVWSHRDADHDDD
jgi:hypothetical protein